MKLIDALLNMCLCVCNLMGYSLKYFEPEEAVKATVNRNQSSGEKKTMVDDQNATRNSKQPTVKNRNNNEYCYDSGKVNV